MSRDPIVGRRQFVDGLVRPVFLDEQGEQYVLDSDGQTQLYGCWLAGDGADEPLRVEAQQA